MDTLGHQFHGDRPACAFRLAARGSAQGVHVARHLTGQKLDESGAENARRVAFVADRLQGLVRPVYHRVTVEIDEGEEVGQQEYIEGDFAGAGILWQPEHALASGAEMRLKLSGNTRRLRGPPLPVCSGRRHPAC